VNAIQVDDVQEMIDAIVALRFAIPYPRGRGIAVVGQGGGPSVQASDQMERVGLYFPPLTPDVRQELGKFLPIKGGIFSNPLDAINILQPDIMYQSMRILGNSPDIHILLYHMGFHPVTRWGDGHYGHDGFLKPATEALLKAQRETRKPLLLALGPASDLTGAEEMFKVQESFVNAGLPVFHSLEKAALTMAKVESWYRRFQAKAEAP